MSQQTCLFFPHVLVPIYNSRSIYWNWTDLMTYNFCYSILPTGKMMLWIVYLKSLRSDTVMPFETIWICSLFKEINFLLYNYGRWYIYFCFALNSWSLPTIFQFPSTLKNYNFLLIRFIWRLTLSLQLEIHTIGIHKNARMRAVEAEECDFKAEKI